MVDVEAELESFRSLCSDVGWTAAIGETGRQTRDLPLESRRKLFIALAHAFREEFPRKGADTELQRRQLARLLKDEFAANDDDASPPVARMSIALARTAGEYEEVIRLCKELVVRHPKQKGFADRAMGAALFSLKRYQEAFDLLSAIPEDVQPESTKKLLGRMATTSAAERARERLRQAFAEADAGRVDEAWESLNRVVTELHPLHASALPCTISALCGKQLEAPLAVEAPGVDDISLVFCGGFRWSGASAVYDYLADQPSVAMFWRKPRFMQDGASTLDKLIGTFKNADEDIVGGLRAFFTEQVLGISLVDHQDDAALIALERSILAQVPEGCDLNLFDNRLAQFFCAVLEAARYKTSREVDFPSASFAAALRALASLSAEEGQRFVLFDSVIRAPQADLLSYVPGALMVAVIRDPRDMYVTHIERGNWKKGIKKYVRELRQLIGDFEESMSSPEIAQSCLPLRFDEFVRNPQVRVEVLDWLGVGHDSRKPNGERFSPEQSAQNIGVYRMFGDEGALRTLEAAFPEYCRGVTSGRGSIKVLTLSAMATKHKQLDRDANAGKPGEPGWARRREITTNILADGAYDFIGLQHCYASRSERFDAVGYFQRSLAERALSYGVINRVTGKDPEEGDSTPLYYRQDRWAVDESESGHVWFKTPAPSADAPGGGGLLFVFGLFRELNVDGSSSGREIYVYNVRLRNKHTDELDVYRARCFTEMTDHIAARSKPHVPVVLMGDTNDKLPGSRADRIMSAQVVDVEGVCLQSSVLLTDALIHCFPDVRGKVRTQHDFKRPGRIKGTARNSRIFCSEGLAVQSARIVTDNENGMFPSYHYPVTASFEFSAG